jgi:ATP-dependent Clp protease adapter protein ClpS
MKSTLQQTILVLLLGLSSNLLSVTTAYTTSPLFSQSSTLSRAFARPSFVTPTSTASPAISNRQLREDKTRLHMSSTEKAKTTKKSVLVKDRTETKPEEQKKKEEMWRVVLHNDEVHTFNYVIRSLCKVIGTLDRKAAFEICVQTHGIGKATVTKTWRKQAEQFCLGLQRQGLTVSISPDEDFDGGHSGGGL